jgi:hypothetical protein
VKTVLPTCWHCCCYEIVKFKDGVASSGMLFIPSEVNDNAHFMEIRRGLWLLASSSSFPVILKWNIGP